MEARFFAIVDMDRDGEVVVKITHEGVIVDLECDGEVVATWGATAQELADDYCH